MKFIAFFLAISFSGFVWVGNTLKGHSQALKAMQATERACALPGEKSRVEGLFVELPLAEMRSFQTLPPCGENLVHFPEFGEAPRQDTTSFVLARHP